MQTKTYAFLMDIGKHYAQLGSRFPVLLTLVLLIIIPSSTGYIDCRISCRKCHENTEHPAVLEVYCAMCEECKQRRRERMLGRTTKGKVKSTLKSLVRMRDGIQASTDSEALIIRPQEALQQAEQDSQQQYQGQLQQQLEPQQRLEPQQLFQPQQEPPEPQQPQMIYASQKALRGMVYPAGCPTPPICSDSEDEVEEPLVNKEQYTIPTIPTTTITTTTPTTTTTTTTTTTPPCPPVQTCRKKKKNIQHPCMNPCMVPPAMCPCPMYPPPPPQVPGYLQPPPQVPGYLQPPPQGPGYMAPPPQESGFLSPPPQGPGFLPPPPQGPGCLQAPPQGSMVFPQTNQPSTMNEDYHYVFIGLPKNTI